VSQQDFVFLMRMIVGQAHDGMFCLTDVKSLFDSNSSDNNFSTELSGAEWMVET
jgi:hypothetical protein